MNQVLKPHEYLAKDITVIISVRLSVDNPWLLERLTFQARSYAPKPTFLVMDFGSEGEYKEQLRRLCAAEGLDYQYVDDTGLFSNGIARNLAFKTTSSDLLLFTDADCFFRSDSFSKLAVLASELDFNKHQKIFFNFPVYHLSREATNELIHSRDYADRLLTKWSFFGEKSQCGYPFEFIAPYSNIFLCHKNFFDMSGGYAADFRGHGSEDFEFMLRLCLLNGYVPEAELIEDDYYGPLQESFYRYKEYKGFRRMFEMMSHPVQSLGLKTFHLWHPRATADEWNQTDDSDRTRFKSVVDRYLTKRTKLLEEDHLQRDRNALCLFLNNEHMQYFLPLRLFNYRLSTDVLNIENFDDIFFYGEEADFTNILNRADKSGAKIIKIAKGQKVGSLELIDFQSKTKIGHANYSLRQILAEDPESHQISVDYIQIYGQEFHTSLGDENYPFSWNSYMAGHLNTGPVGEHIPRPPSLIQKLARKYKFIRLLRKFFTKPRQFFSDSWKKRIKSSN